mgnify:CR=1 FL=1
MADEYNDPSWQETYSDTDYDEDEFRSDMLGDEPGQTRFKRAQKLAKLGMDERTYKQAQKLYGITQGEKTEGQIEAEKQLAILSQAQRGRAMGVGGFGTAELMQRAGRSAQQAELGGEAAIEAAAVQARQGAGSALEDLLIAGTEQKENQRLAMQQIALQQEQARGALFSNVLSGVLSAISSGVGLFGGGPSSYDV